MASLNLVLELYMCYSQLESFIIVYFIWELAETKAYIAYSPIRNALFQLYPEHHFETKHPGHVDVPPSSSFNKMGYFSQHTIHS